MIKVDFKKTLDCYHARHNEFQVIEVPKMQYLMIDGHGDPNTGQDFKNAIEKLYPLAYKLKFASKIELGKDYVVMPLEGLWWAENMDSFTTQRDKSKWDFTLMIMQPEWITQEMFELVVEKVSKKDPSRDFSDVRLEELDEGLCVQTLHIGSYDNEADILDRMHNDFVPSNQFRMIKKHHEIYLSDSRKTATDKLRTILRQPIAKIN